MGISSGETIRTELYVQLMKQLSENSNESSVQKGWELMALCLSTFAPPENIQNFVAMFILKHVSSA